MMNSPQARLIRTPWLLLPVLLLILPAGPAFSRPPLLEAGAPPSAPASAVMAEDETDGAGDAVHPPLTWERLESRLVEAERDGFSGSVLMVRKGKIVLDRGYGYADPVKKIRNGPDTIYAIGSTPIDFTKAAVLLLVQQGKLSTSDTLANYFKGIPEDKAEITIEQLMTGRSGLKDFLGRPGDPNPDHHYIDRDVATRRIFADDLVFEPGTERRHSHAAWGVLATIIELVSGLTYPQFTVEHLFEPAGMKDTGFFGVPYPAERMAVGQSPTTSGEINAPPYWGQTSWLVMGSGGQVSTTRDMHRWHRAMADGRILSPEYAERFFEHKGFVGNGGDMFGFEIFYTQDPDNMMVLISNSASQETMPALRALGEGLASLVHGISPAKFSLGIQMEIEADEEADPVVTLSLVVEGGAAHRDGLRKGDRLISANGRPLGEDPLKVLDRSLQTGASIRFEVMRGGSRKSVTVTPNPR